MPNGLESAIFTAVKCCKDSEEEQGGIILVKDSDYQFVQLTNTNTGQDIARVLWTADRKEYASKIVPMLGNGWRHHASFHSHPKFYPRPSQIDLTQLFLGFKTNYIYSGLTHEIVEYTWDKNVKHLEITNILKYGA